MFKTLTMPRIHWAIYALFALGINCIPGMNIFSILALLITLHQLFLLFNSINHIIPIRYLIGFLTCVQILVGPVLVYHGFEQYQYKPYRMQIPEYDYFMYTLPAVAALIIGMHFKAKNHEGERINATSLKEYIHKHQYLPYIFVILGFIAGWVSVYTPGQLAFVFYVLTNLKWIGVFMLIFTDFYIRFIPMALVFLEKINSSLSHSGFYDLITWTIFFSAFCCIRYQPSNYKKLLLGCAFLLSVIFIQSEKYSYREVIQANHGSAGITTFTKVYLSKIREYNGFFRVRNLAPSITRINQGFIITYVMKNVPSSLPFQNGKEMLQIFEAAILPRFIAPNKLKSGNLEIFHKYTSGLVFPTRDTVMNLSPIGDSYLNFGKIGGAFCMLFIGLLFNLVLIFLNIQKTYYPILLLFTPLIFFYALRADGASETIFGQVIKSEIVIFGILLLIRIYTYYKSKIMDPK